MAMQGDKYGVFYPISPRSASWLTPAPRITISGDAGWTTCPWVNGSGTWEDPYVLRNLSINAGGTGNCITISNTVKYFRIVNCTLTGSGTPVNNAGIYLGNAGNGTLLNNTCHTNSNGIYMVSANNITIKYNNCSANSGHGIEIMGTTKNNTLIDNNCTGNSQYGIVLIGGNQTLVGNNCSSNYIGIYVSISSNISLTENLCAGNSRYGIYIDSQSNNDSINSNDCIGNSLYGIFLKGGNSSLTNNNCSENILGIYLSSANNNTLTGNNCTGNSQSGIYLENASYNTLESNSLTENSMHGVNLSLGSKYNLLTGNNCTGNFINGICLNYSNNNTLAGNNCSHNTNSGIQIRGSNATIIIENTCDKNNIGIVLNTTSYYNEIYLNWLKKSATSPMINNNPTNNVHDNPIINYSLAAFTTNVTSIIGNQWVNFTDNATSGGLFLTYQWNFGDVPDNETSPSVIHQYTTSGIWNTILTIKDSDGDVSVAQQAIQVEEDFQPVAVITPTQLFVPLGSITDLYATITGNSPANYTWDFGDETPLENGTHVTHLYGALGNYTITLNVTDIDGDFATITSQVEIYNTPPLIHHLDSFSFREDATGNRIIWLTSDPNVHNPTYNVTRNGNLILSGPWIPDASIFIELDGYTAGTYTFTLTINDGYGGISLESVIVIITALPQRDTPTWGIVETISTIILAIVVVAGVVFIIQRRKWQLRSFKST